MPQMRKEYKREDTEKIGVCAVITEGSIAEPRKAALPDSSTLLCLMPCVGAERLNGTA